MSIIDLSLKNSLLNSFVAELRNIEIQNDPMRFRKNLIRIGEIMAYEISKELTFKEQKIKTPLASFDAKIVENKIVLGTIMRAGLPFHEGFLNYYDYAENAFVSAYRKYTDKEHFDIHVEYISSPHLTGKTLILVDPMLATGTSFELAYQALLSKGKPSKTYFASVIASRDGVDYLSKFCTDEHIALWCAAIDPELNSKSYIVPGLGDAGDLAFGEKI